MTDTVINGRYLELIYESSTPWTCEPAQQGSRSTMENSMLETPRGHQDRLHTASSLFISLLASLVFPLVSLLIHEVGHSVPDLHPDRGITPLCSTYHLHIHTAALAYCRLLVYLLVSFAHPPTSPLIPVLRA